jgi:hypothetical protein
VRLSGDIVEGDDKCVATERAVLAMVDATRMLRTFAAGVAKGELLVERALGHEPEPRAWAAVDMAIRYAAGAASPEPNAAWNAAWSAAENAARNAAWSAAENAARNAAWSAAERAADSAAENATQPDLETAWRVCEDGSWMLWGAAEIGVRRKSVVLATCDCVRPALPYVPAGENRPRVAIETAEKWARGEATLGEVYAASLAAYAAATAAAKDLDPGRAVPAADAASLAAFAAADATAAAAAATYAVAVRAAYAAARSRVLRECADLVRARIPWSEVEAALARGKGGA